MKSGILFLILGTIGILLAVVGFPAFLLWHVASLGMDEGGVFHGAEKQFMAPGEVVVSLEKPGDYLLWLHYRATFEGEEYSFPPEVPTGLEVEMEEVETGDEVGWVPFGEEMDFTVEVSEVGRKNLGVFDVAEPGAYRLEITGDFEPRVFSIATAPLDDLVGGIGTLFIVAFLVGLTGLGLLIFGVIQVIKGRSGRSAGYV